MFEGVWGVLVRKFLLLFLHARKFSEHQVLSKMLTYKYRTSPNYQLTVSLSSCITYDCYQFNGDFTETLQCSRNWSVMVCGQERNNFTVWSITNSLMYFTLTWTSPWCIGFTLREYQYRMTFPHTTLSSHYILIDSMLKSYTLGCLNDTMTMILRLYGIHRSVAH